MERDELIERLDVCAGPVTPFMTNIPLLQWHSWCEKAAGLDLFEALVDLIATPPPAGRVRYATVDEWHQVLRLSTGWVGKRHPDMAMRRLLPLLDDDRARLAVIEVLGYVGDDRALPELDRLVQDGCLCHAELVALAETLADIGGEAAWRLLQHLRENASQE
jgi:hypothetical protein